MRKQISNKYILALASILYLCISCSSPNPYEPESVFLPSDKNLPPTLGNVDDDVKSIFIPDQLRDQVTNVNAGQESTPNIPEITAHDDLEKAKAGSYAATHLLEDDYEPVDKTTLNKQQELSQSKIRAMDSEHESDRAFISESTSDTLSKMRNSGNKNFSFLVYRDDYNYKSNNGAFDYTYRYEGGGNTSSSDFSGILRFTGHDMHQWRHLTVGWGFALGVGYNGGYGFFDREKQNPPEQSDTHFLLWTVPLDLSFMMELEPFSWLKLSGLAGPSFMTVIQSRDDLDKKDDRKTMTQFSPGYFAAVRGNISLSKIGFFKSTSFDLFDSYSITRYFLTVEARMQNYSSFLSDDLSIDGVSIGAGMTFEYF